METSFLAWLKGRTRHLPQPRLGIGDDAAVLDPATLGHGCVATCDTIVDKIDFDTRQHSLRRIGHKALAINLSDLAAMAARPVAILISLSLPRDQPSRTAAELYEGMLPLAEMHQVAIAGGDITVYDGPLTITITAIGAASPAGVWRRDGAQAGDAVVVSGAFGGSLRSRHLDVQPRVDLALQLREAFGIRAAIDVSDGLSLDLDRLCAASLVGAELTLSAIPIHEDCVRHSEETGRSPLDHALSDGEDFELILAVPRDELNAVLSADFGAPLTTIGVFTGRTGLWTIQEGAHTRISPRGYLHGSDGDE